MPLTKVTSGVIAANAVVDSFGTQSITGDKIGLNAITGNTLASNIINANNIVNNTITGNKIALGTITGDDIAVNQITGNLLTANCVSGNNIVSSPTITGNVTINGSLSLGGATTPSSGIGIKFPATQVPSADANTLDDYEEGTWTPNVGGNATYLAQSGHYTKIGNFVKLRFYMQINSLGTGSNIAISGMPFTPASSDPSIVGGVVTYVNNLATSVLALGIYAQSAGTLIYFMTRNSSSTAATTQQPAVMGNNFQVFAEVSYMV